MNKNSTNTNNNFKINKANIFISILFCATVFSLVICNKSFASYVVPVVQREPSLTFQQLLDGATISREEFEITRKKFLDLYTDQYHKIHAYAVIKKIVTEESLIFIHADLHGDKYAILAFIKDLLQRKIMKTDDPFKLDNNNDHIVFLGDFVDRGPNGPEVWYTLMRLKIANPKNVHLLRGNHEDTRINTANYEKDHTIFFNELRRKNFFQNKSTESKDLSSPEKEEKMEKVEKKEQISPITSEKPKSKKRKREEKEEDEEVLKAEKRRKEEKEKKIEKEKVEISKDYSLLIKEFNDLFKPIYLALPVALYFGIKNDSNFTNYILFTHGGIDPRFNPNKLLDNDNKDAIEYINVNNINGFKEKNFKEINEQFFKDLPKNLLLDLASIGFTWSDFLIEKDKDGEINVKSSDRMKIFDPNLPPMMAYGENITKIYLDLCSTKNKYQVNAIIRGHQHADTHNNKFLTNLVNNGSVYGLRLDDDKQYKSVIKSWKTKNPQINFPGLEMPKCSVWTILASPATFTGTGFTLKYDVYTILHFPGKEFKDWRLRLVGLPQKAK